MRPSNGSCGSHTLLVALNSCSCCLPARPQVHSQQPQAPAGRTCELGGHHILLAALHLAGDLQQLGAVRAKRAQVQACRGIGKGGETVEG